MSIKNCCIYCGAEEDLSESDIIPDALTNARITNKNVCRYEHNNKFSDLFESKVIGALAFISNKLDVKSGKSKNFASYKATVDIGGIGYDVSMTSGKELFNGRVLKSVDKKHLMSSVENVTKIAKDPNKVELIDVNNIVIEEKVKIDLEIFFDETIFRLMAKIAFEWYCAKNKVSGYHEEFNSIISFITTGKGTNPVAIIQNEELYNYIGSQHNLGSHLLFGYQNEDKQIVVVISLFGVAMYKVTLSDHTPDFCVNNFLYQELCTDSSRKEVVHSTIESAQDTFLLSLSDMRNTTSVPLGNGLEAIIKMDPQDVDLLLYTNLFNIVKCFNGIKDETTIPNETIVAILLKNIRSITEASLLHKKSIKRFVREHFEEGHVKIIINPKSSNKKDIFMYFILMHIGKSGVQKLDDATLQNITKKAFGIKNNTEIIVSEQMENHLKTEILKTPEYAMLLECGAEVVNRWE